MLNTTGKYNLIDISFLLPVNSDDTVLLIGENALLAEGLSKVCKRVIKNTISSPLCDKGSLDLIIVNDMAKGESLNSQLSTLNNLLKEGGYICLPFFNVWRGGYSYRCVSRKLIEAGFKDIESYIPIPSHINPKFIITTKDDSPLKYYLSHHFERDSFYKSLIYIAVRLSSAAGIFKYIAPSYIITARKFG
ncbi:MAG: hypothetical protein HY279_04365 [Nitrospinae bacterium]|nr:hypothetical protein [Nitrospinota bacterium]